MAKQNKTICLSSEEVKIGEKNFTEKGFKSFSEYIGQLIIKDNEK